jgi:hypothetical protein
MAIILGDYDLDSCFGKKRDERVKLLNRSGIDFLLLVEFIKLLIVVISGSRLVAPETEGSNHYHC